VAAPRRLPPATLVAALVAAPAAAPTTAPARETRSAGRAATGKTVRWAEAPVQPASGVAVAVAAVAIAAALVGMVLLARRRV